MKRERHTPIRRVNQHLWVLDPLVDLPGCLVRSMFGCRSCYFNDLLVLVLADKEEPWNGILVPTERAHHAELLRAFPSLVPHPVLPKWLYLSAEHTAFESVATHIVERIRALDPLFGIVPPAKRSRRRTP